MATRAKTKTEPEVIEGNAEEVEQPAAPNGVFVIKVVDDKGNISTDLQTTGNVQATEVQTILELAIVRWREQLGFGQASR